MFICFNDQKMFPCYRVDGNNEYIKSEEDILSNSNRETFKIHFSPDEVSIEELLPYYVDAANRTNVITITGDDGKKFYHLNYILPLSLGFEKTNDDENQHIVMKLGQLTNTDTLIRNLGGKQKVYTGTPLEIAIAKKHDEISKECNEEIEKGIDIGEDHYSLTLPDQTNIGAWLAFANAGLPVPYHADGKGCRVYTADEFKNIAYFAIYFITAKTTYCNMLIRMMETMETEEEVIAVKFGETELTGEYLENYTYIMNNLPIQVELPEDNAGDPSNGNITDSDNTSDESVSDNNTNEPLPEVDDSITEDSSNEHTPEENNLNEDNA